MSPVFQFVHNRKLIFCTFIITNTDSQNFFLSFCVDSQNYVSCELSDHAIVSYGVVDRIDVENEIYFV